MKFAYATYGKLIIISFPAVLLALTLCMCGCSGDDTTPVSTSSPGKTAFSDYSGTCTNLWGYYAVSIDTEDETVHIVPNRTVDFTANLTNILNNQPLSMKISIVDLNQQPQYTDISVDIQLTHPFPGMMQFRGYDVRGIFMGDGSSVLDSGGVICPTIGSDQYLLNSDGYTRWFNKSEFTTGGMPLLSYTPGIFTSAGFNGTATLNGYKYFTNSLGKTTELVSFLIGNPSNSGVFTPGATNTRRYDLRFPANKGIVFGYAVIGDWTAPDVHPSNAREAVACEVNDQSDVWFVDESYSGGNLIFDITLVDWHSQPVGGTITDYRIIVESTVLSAPYVFTDTDMTVTDNGTNWASFHVEIPADNITSLDGNEFWVIAEYDGYDYSNEFGVINDAWDEPLKAYFRFDLPVSDTPPGGNQDPVCTLDVVTEMPAENWGEVNVEFDASESYDPDPGDTLTFSWDFNGNGIFGEDPEDAYTGPDDKPVHTYTEDFVGEVSVKIEDGNGGEAVCSVDVDVTVWDPVLFFWTGESGSGDPLTGYNGWQYVGGTDMVWDDNGNTNGFFTGCLNTWLVMPELELPDESLGNFDLRIRIKHWGGANPPWLFYPNTNGFDSAGYLSYRLGSGDWVLNSDTTPWLTHHSGQNFNAVNPSNLAIGGQYSWCPYLGNMGAYIWNNRCFGAMQLEQYWGSKSSPWDSTFTIDPDLKGETVQFGFYWAGLEKDMGKQSWPGWCIREIEIYIAPS
ncbi:MAG TPA: hypothetical protein ENN67_08485 [Firmicutes bacterium]|nr:hypothetical protein [Bacillota bacterium]